MHKIIANWLTEAQEFKERWRCPILLNTITLPISLCNGTEIFYETSSLLNHVNNSIRQGIKPTDPLTRKPILYNIETRKIYGVIRLDLYKKAKNKLFENKSELEKDFIVKYVWDDIPDRIDLVDSEEMMVINVRNDY